MSNTRYLEIDSTYRDRSRYPLPGQFEIPISQTGRKSQLTAVDPVSMAVPTTAWTSNLIDANTPGPLLSGTIDTIAGADNIAASSSQTTFIVTSLVAGDLQQGLDYYHSLILNDTTLGVGRRIIEYEYIGVDSGGLDKARITVSPAFPDTFALGDAWTINDPTDLSDPSNPLFFVPNGRSGNNAYIGCVLYNETLNESRPITEYDVFTHILQVDTSVAFGGPVVWALTDNYSIRKEQPAVITTVGAAPTSTSVVITGGSTVNDFYNGQFLRIRASTYGNSITAPETEIRRIVRYDASTFTATVSPSFSTAPLVGSSIEILYFSFDNLNPFVYTGSTVSQQEMVCYEIELLNLVLPNKVLTVGEGSRIAFYPYVYVELANVSGSSAGVKNVIYSNNPNSTRMMFRAAIDDVPNPVFSSFIKIDGDGMVQTIKFKPNDNLKFSVRLPNGQIYDTVEVENFTPKSPNPLGQISALFSLKRL